MTELKTKQNEKSVQSFLDSVTDPARHQDCRALLELMKKVTGEVPKMWGDSIVGFGAYHYKYESGREGDWFLTGFSPRKANLTLYLMTGFSSPLVERLGKFKTGKSCLYINKLADINLAVLAELLEESVAATTKKR